jgi:hypothetical protein
MREGLRASSARGYVCDLRGCLVGAVAGLVFASVLSAPAAAQPAQTAVGPVAFVLWTGGIAGGTSNGVLLTANGTGERLRASLGGVVSKVGPFNPKGGKLAAIRAAAHDAMAGPSFVNRNAPGQVPVDGAYIAATFDAGGHRDAAVALNAPSAGLDKLLAGVNDALNPSQRLVTASAAALRARTAALAATAPCAPGDFSSAAYKDVSLGDATRSGLTTLKSKGGLNADDVAIDAKWKRLPGSITARVNVEITAPPDQPELVELFKSTVEKQLSGYKLGAGSEARTPVRFEVNVRARGATPTPCFNQIVINNDENFRAGGTATELGTDFGVSNPGSIEVTSFDQGAWAHETLHLMGLPDKYHDVFQVGGREFPLPENGLEGQALADALAKVGVKPNQGFLTAKNRPGVARNDIMGVKPEHGRISAKDLRRMAGSYFIRITGVQGTILANENGADQNYLAEHLNGPTRNELLVPPGGTAHADGIYGYCLDLTRHIPQAGEGLDVVGNVFVQSDPASEALAKVLNVIIRRPHDPSSFFATVPGAQEAIWQVTDRRDPALLSADTRQILVDAGVDPAQTFSYQHVTDPGASSPGSAAYDPTSGTALPPAATLPQPADRPPPAARLLGLRFPHRVKQHTRLLVARLDLGGSETQVTLVIQRAGGRRVKLVKSLGTNSVEPGRNFLLVALPRLRPGKYVLAAIPVGAFEGKRVTFRVTR